MRLRLSALTGSLLAAVVVVGAALASAGADYRASFVEEASTALQAASDTLTFPGAVGGGARALMGCRAGDLHVIHVTDTATTTGVGGFNKSIDSASALPATDLKVIQIDSAGIYSTNDYRGTGLDCTIIAGQLARGQHILTGSRHDYNTNHNDLVWSFLTMRKHGIGWEISDVEDGYVVGVDVSHARQAGGRFNLNVSGDTASGGEDEVRGVTVQSYLSAEPDTGGGRTGPRASGSPRGDPPAKEVTLYQGWYHSGTRRNPLNSTDSVETINTVVYNWEDGAFTINHQFTADLLQSSYRHGPGSPTGVTNSRAYPISFSDACNQDGGDNTCHRGLYIENLLGPWFFTDAQYSATREEYRNGSDSTRIITADFDNASAAPVADTFASLAASEHTGSPADTGAYFPQSRWLPSGTFVADAPAQDIRTVEDSIVTYVGNAFRRNCGMGWTTTLQNTAGNEVRDSIALRYKAEYDTTGGDTNQGGTIVNDIVLPTMIRADSACTNADGDDIADRWEVQVIGDTTTIDSSNQDSVGTNGLMIYESYLWDVDPDVGVNSDEVEVNGIGGFSLSTATYGDDRFVLHAPVSNVDTFCLPTGDCSGGGTQTITATHLTSAGSGANQSSYTTASITPTDSSLVLAWLFDNNPAEIADSIVGAGLDFTFVDTATAGDGSHGIELWRAQATSGTSSGALTIYYPSSQGRALWSISEFDSVTVGSNGGAAIVQDNDSINTGGQDQAAAVTLAAFGASANRAAAGFGLSQRTDALNAGTNFTILGQDQTERSLGSEWRSDASDTEPDVSWTNASAWAGIAVEIEASSSSAPADTLFIALLNRDTVPPEETQCAGIWLAPDTTEALCVPWATDTPSVTNSILDSAQVDSLCTDWGTCTEGGLKGITIAMLERVRKGVLALVSNVRSAIERWARPEVPTWR